MKPYFIILIVGVVISLGAAIIYTNLPKPQAVLNSSPLNDPPNEESVSVDSKTGKYINHQYGFEVTYPKVDMTYMANCEVWKESKESPVNVEVFKDSKNSRIYVSDTKTVKIGQDNSCQNVTTTLGTIRDNLPATAMSFSYAKVSTDSALLAFGEKNLGVTDCQISSKEFVKGTKDTYKIALRGQGDAGNPGGSCWLNAAYQFLYSPTSKTAVISSGYQNLMFNGINGQKIPQVKLID